MTVFEFDCPDCHCHVYALCPEGMPLPVRCSVCTWVAEFVTDPEEAKRIRDRLEHTHDIQSDQSPRFTRGLH